MIKTTSLTAKPAGGDPSDEDTFVGSCPFCDAPLEVTWAGGSAGPPVAVVRCAHYRRAWIVSADKRRRAEFDNVAAPPAAAA